MEELVLAQEELFQGEMVEVWRDSKHNYYMSREQIGEVLGYKNPRKAIKDIHIRNKSRMDKFSIVAKVKGGAQIAPPSEENKKQSFIVNMVFMRFAENQDSQKQMPFLIGYTVY
ncbi:hypothetical protein EL456_14175 [Enterococcus faecalis]|nr:hypothetical protein [Enterococcus faecalis]